MHMAIMSRTQAKARLCGGALALMGLGASAALAVAPFKPVATSQPASETRHATVQPEAQPVTGDVVVYFLDGRRIEGRLIRQDPAEIVVRIAGIETTLGRGEIVRIEPVPPVEEHYRRLRAVVADDDLEQRLVLADWLRVREAYHLALEELRHILTVDPGNAEAQRLKALVEGQIRLRMEAAQVGGPEREVGQERRRRPDFPVPDQSAEGLRGGSG
jgi:hypothetical protein